MSAPSPKEIDSMKNLIMLMNESSDMVDYVEPSPAPRAAMAPVSTGPSSPDAGDMKRILEAFMGANEDAYGSLREEAETSPRLREAMQTRRTDHGVQIGGWEVRAKLNESAGREVKTYDVLNANSKERLFDGLVILEAAHAIVRYLNKGLATDHNKITEIADLEEVYRRNRQDAAIFKKRYNRCVELKETAAGEVFEARYQKSRAQAIIANDQIKTILDNIR